METEDRQAYTAMGEEPDIPDSFGRSLLRSIVGQARRMRSGMKDDHEVGIRMYRPGPQGKPEPFWDGSLEHLHFERSPDERNVVVKLKDTVRDDFKEHPLRDGVTLTVGGLLLLGSGLYIRSRNKK